MARLDYTREAAGKCMFEKKYQLWGLVIGAVFGLFIGGIGIAGLGSALGVPGFALFGTLGWIIGKVKGLRKDKELLEIEVQSLRRA